MYKNNFYFNFIDNFDFSREARSSFRGLGFATASQLGPEASLGKCLEEELLLALVTGGCGYTGDGIFFRIF